MMMARGPKGGSTCNPDTRETLARFEATSCDDDDDDVAAAVAVAVAVVDDDDDDDVDDSNDMIVIS